MTRKNSAILFAMLLALPFCSFAQLNIVTTVKPVGLIAKDIVGDYANVDVLLPDSASPHDYALKPSDIRKLRQADRVIWVGPELELFLADMLAGAENATQLTRYPGMPLRYFAADDDHGHHDDHGDHHGHSHDGIDGHVWLGPEQSKVIAKAVYEQLVKLQPQHQAIFAANLKVFDDAVDDTVKALNQQFAQTGKHGYFLFHDGYGYFEHQFGLTPLGHLTIDPERKPGAKTLVAIRKAIQEGQAKCVFSEPQYNPAIIEALVKNSQTKVTLLDPMAKNLQVGKDSYIDFLRGLGESYSSCFR